MKLSVAFMKLSVLLTAVSEPLTTLSVPRMGQLLSAAAARCACAQRDGIGMRQWHEALACGSAITPSLFGNGVSLPAFGAQDMRFQELMPDVLHWLGVKKIDELYSMSDMKYDAIVGSGASTACSPAAVAAMFCFRGTLVASKVKHVHWIHRVAFYSRTAAVAADVSLISGHARRY